MTEIKLRVLKVDQPIGEFYIGAIDARELNRIATVDVREFRDSRAKSIAGIQRNLSPTRLKEISNYVNFDYATFPTSVVIAIDERCAKLLPVKGCAGLYDLVISSFEGDDEEAPIPIEETAFIIDGQHRLAGLENLEEQRNFEVNLSIFVGADLADKAEIFSTVNLAQTKVNRSLVYDLFSYANSPIPFKMAHEVTIALDQDSGGPFFEKIKRLGVTTPTRKQETLSQATVVKGILRHMPRNPDKEKNKGFLGFATRSEPGEDWHDRIFVTYYRSDDDISVFKILTNYFRAVQRTWPGVWDDDEEGFILNRTNRYNALMRYLKDCYLYLVETPSVVRTERFAEIFGGMQIAAKEFTSDRFKPGSSGASELYRLFVERSPF